MNKKDVDVSSEEVELEASENLLSRLNKQHRMMERNRRQYHDETTVILNKQRKMLADLEQEQKKLKEELKVASNKKHKIKDEEAKHALSAILDRQEQYEKQIAIEREKIRNQDSMIKIMENNLRSSRKKVPSAPVLEEDIKTAKDSNVILENRIQQATVRLNAVLADNAILRNSIDNLLKERDKLLLQAKRMEKQLSKTIKKKSDVMDQVTKAYAEREEAQVKMRTLKDRIEQDTLKYSNEMKKIQRAIDFQTNLRSFVNTITIGDDQESSRRRPEEENDDVGIEGLLENYRRSIAYLEEMSDSSSVENLLTNYLQVENDNYTLFSYISDLSNEVASLNADVNKIREEIANVQTRKSQYEEDKTLAFDKMNAELDKTMEEVAGLEEEERKSKGCLIEVIAATSELICLLDCDPKSVQELVGANEVTASNLPIFLSIIEQKIQEIVQMRDSLRSEVSSSPNVVKGLDSDEEGSYAPTDVSSIDSKILTALPHFGHLYEDEISGPLTHLNLLSVLKTASDDEGGEA